MPRKGYKRPKRLAARLSALAAVLGIAPSTLRKRIAHHFRPRLGRFVARKR